MSLIKSMGFKNADDLMNWIVFGEDRKFYGSVKTNDETYDF